MKEHNVILDKSFAFGLRVVKLFLHLRENKVDRVLIIQLLRSGTSVGANVEEAVGGQTKKDFIAKMSIAYKEIREVTYWIRLLRDASILEVKLADSFLFDAEELRKIIISILKSAKSSSVRTR